MTGHDDSRGDKTERRRVVGGFVGSVVVTALGIAQQVLLVPLFLKAWPTDLYASWLLLYAISVLVLILDFGLHPLSVNRYQSASGPGKEAELASEVRLFSMSYLANAVLMALVCGLFMIVVDPVALLNLTGASYTQLYAALILMIGAGLLAVLMSGISAVYRATLRVSALMRMRAIILVGQIGLQAVILFSGGTIVHMALAFLVTNLAQVVYALTVDLRPAFGGRLPGIERYAARRHVDTMRQSGAFVIPMAAESISNQGPILVLGIVGISPGAIVGFNLTRLLTSIPRSLAQQVGGVIGPEIGARHRSNEKVSLNRSLRLGLAISALIIGVSSGAMVGLIEPLFNLWTRHTVDFDGVVAIFLFAALIITSHVPVAFSTLVFTDEARGVSRVLAIRIFAMLLLVFLLGWLFGVRGAAAGIALADLLFGMLQFQMLLARKFGLANADLFRWTAFPLIASLVAFTATSAGLSKLLDLNDWGHVLMACSGLGIVAVGITFVVFQRVQNT